MINTYLKDIRFSVFVIFLCFCINISSQSYQYSFQNTELTDEERIENLLSMMTLDEQFTMFGGTGVDRLGVRGAGAPEAIHGRVQGGPCW